ncbi:MAG: PIG-L deacetylase family protein [Terriglobia bacterium]
MATEPSRQAWDRHYESWRQYLARVTGAVESGKSVPLGPSAEPLTPPRSLAEATAQAKVIICAPHPDDEALSGALALRLRLDSGAAVTSVAVTLGRDQGQRPRRLRELERACQALGFKLVVPRHPHGLDEVTEYGRRTKPDEWREKVNLLREIFDREMPEVVLAPHAQDFNTAHVGTHLLVLEALGEHLNRRDVLLVETEFWHQMERPNLMLGLTPEFVAAQLVGIAEHGDEMRRNPYHLLHPCRLMDNVRRGSEVVGGQGAVARKFTFAEIYNVRLMRAREQFVAPERGCIIDPETPLSVAGLKSQLGFGPG